MRFAAIDIGSNAVRLLFMQAFEYEHESVFKRDEKIADARSFDIGTVRMLNSLVREDAWKRMEYWLKRHASKFPAFEGIGSGGGINTMFALSRKKLGTPISCNGLYAAQLRNSG